MYKATIVNHGIRVTKTGDSVDECLARLQNHLKTFHGEDYELTFNEKDSSIYIDNVRVIGTLFKELPNSHDDGI